MQMVYYSFTGNTKRFVNKLDVDIDMIEISNFKIQDKFVLVVPTYNIGQIPEEVTKFLDRNGSKLVGVIATGNRSWGRTYGIAGNKIASLYDVPLLHKLELAGNEKDVNIVNNIIENLL